MVGGVLTRRNTVSSRDQSAESRESDFSAPAVSVAGRSASLGATTGGSTALVTGAESEAMTPEAESEAMTPEADSEAMTPDMTTGSVGCENAPGAGVAAGIPVAR